MTQTWGTEAPMRRYILILSTLALLCWPPIATAQVEFPTSDAFVKSILNDKSSLDTQASGDLNGDGLADWAGLVRREKRDFFSTYQLYVLLRQPAGGYRVAETSTEAQIPGMGCCWVEDLRINRSSIYIQNNAKPLPPWKQQRISSSSIRASGVSSA